MASFAILTKYIFREPAKEKIVFFYSLGMGPPLASLMLYYLLLLAPKQGNLFYLGIIISFFLVLIALNGKSIVRYGFQIKTIINSFIGVFRINKSFRTIFFGQRNLLFMAVFLSFLVVWDYSIYWFYYGTYLFLSVLLILLIFKFWRTYLKNKITTFFRFFRDIFSFEFNREDYPYFNETCNHLGRGNNFFVIVVGIVSLYAIRNLLLSTSLGHDFLEYIVQAGYMFDDKAIIYSKEIYNQQTGFYYVGLHGWSFPLQYTLERLVDSFTTFGFGLYIQSLTLWYGLLILAIVYAKLKEHFNLRYTISAILIMVFAKGYLIAASYSHIDSYRIFFFTLSVFFTLQIIHKSELRIIPLLAFMAGTSAFAHSLGVFVAVVLGATLLFYLQRDWITRIKYVVGFGLLVLIFGVVHYLIDIFYGTGWIFKEIDFY
jgi:hypothetical protein